MKVSEGMVIVGEVHEWVVWNWESSGKCFVISVEKPHERDIPALLFCRTVLRAKSFEEAVLFAESINPSPVVVKWPITVADILHIELEGRL